jgi:hypothetical protein
MVRAEVLVLLDNERRGVGVCERDLLVERDRGIERDRLECCFLCERERDGVERDRSEWVANSCDLLWGLRERERGARVFPLDDMLFIFIT